MVAILEIKILYEKFLIMMYLGILSICLVIWISYEIWRAPLLEEKEDGTYITKRPTKKLSDLWRKRS